MVLLKYIAYLKTNIDALTEQTLGYYLLISAPMCLLYIESRTVSSIGTALDCEPGDTGSIPGWCMSLRTSDLVCT
jgi:hypothetical protein